MSLTLFKVPKKSSIENANELQCGTWFLDKYGQVFVIVLDDRTSENRVICLGDYCKPFIPNISADNIEVKKLLRVGTLLKISQINSDQEGR